MHPILLIQFQVIAYLAGWVHAEDSRYSFGDDVTVEDHGKIVEFERTRKIIGKMVAYNHKGIVFVPRAYGREIPFFDSNNEYIRFSEPYVIHFWHPGPRKEDATIRIDRLRDVILGDPMKIVEDGPGVLPIGETVDRSISELGHRSRRKRYNLAANNCGNFVARMKTGRGDSDVQFPTIVDDILQPKSRVAAKIAQGVFGVTERKFKKYDTANAYAS